MSLLKHDYYIYINEHELNDFSKIKKIVWLLIRSTFIIVLFYRLSNHPSKLVKLFTIPLYKLIRILSGVQISRSCKIGGGLFLPHFGTIVLNKKAIYGNCLTIYHGVTVGAKGDASMDMGVPKIGSNVRISTNAIVLGNITIGNNVTVGAGAVVVKSVPSNSIVVGNPAKYRVVVSEKA